MSLTKAEISAKFSSGEWKFTSNGGTYTSYARLSHEELITKLETGLNSCHNDFLIVVSFLLATGEKKKMGTISDGLGIMLVNKFLKFRKMSGGTFTLVNLDDDGTFWGSIETGTEKRSLIYWAAYCSVRLETSVILNFKPDFREIDPRVYCVADVVGGECVFRKDHMYQAHHGSLESYYRQIEMQVQRLQRLAQDVSVPRPIFQPFPAPQPFGFPSSLKRRLDQSDPEPPAKLPRKE